MKNRPYKKIISLMLCASMVLQSASVTGLAADMTVTEAESDVQQLETQASPAEETNSEAADEKQQKEKSTETSAAETESQNTEAAEEEHPEKAKETEAETAADTEAETVTAEAASVRAQIAALPTTEELKAMSQEAQMQVYEKAQDAEDAYQSLPEEQKALLSGDYQALQSLFAYFHVMAEPAELDYTITWDTSKTYRYDDGKPVTVDNLVVKTSGGVTLTEGTDYDVTYRNNTTVSSESSAEIVIKGKGAYADLEETRYFPILGKEFPEITVKEGYTQGQELPYTGTSYPITLEGLPEGTRIEYICNEEKTDTPPDITNVGYYGITCSLYNQYYESTNVYINIYVIKATNEWIERPSVKNWFIGKEPELFCGKPKFGSEVSVNYTTPDKYENSKWDVQAPTAEGTYRIVFLVAETDNYFSMVDWLDYTISKMEVPITDVTAKDAVYDGTPKKGYEGTPAAAGFHGTFEISYEGIKGTTYPSSSEAPTDAGTYQVSFQMPDDEPDKGGYLALEFTIAQKPLSVTLPVQEIERDGELSKEGIQINASDLISGHTAEVKSVQKSEELCTYTAEIQIQDEKKQDVTANYSFTNTGAYHIYEWASNTHQKECINCHTVKETDTTLPTVMYQIADFEPLLLWEKPLVGSGYFSKEPVTVSIAASDEQSGVKNVSYTIIKNRTRGTEQPYTDPITFSEKGSYLIEVTATDHAENTKVGLTERVVIFEDSQSSASGEFVRTSEEDLSISVDFKGNTVNKVSRGENTLTLGDQYTCDYSSNTITFTNEYLKTLPASETPYTYQISYDPQGELYGKAASGTPAAKTTISLTVKRASGEVSFIKGALWKQYDGIPFPESEMKYTSDSTGAATYEYKLKDADDSTYTTTAPTEAGEYQVRVTVADDDNYAGGSDVVNYTISKATVWVERVPSVSYNGTTQRATIGESALYTVIKNEGGIEAGSYDVVLKLNDSKNFTWRDTTTGNEIEQEEITVPFEITQYTNLWKAGPAISDWTYGTDASVPMAEAEYGDVEILYTGTANDGTTWNSTTAPTKAGSYTAKYSVTETKNYTGLEATRNFVIKKAQLIAQAESKTITYGDAAPEYTIKYEGFQYQDTIADLTEVPYGECQYKQYDKQYGICDDYPIHVEGGSAYNYTIRGDHSALTVKKKPIVIEIQTKTSVYGDELAVLTGNDSGEIVSGDTNVYSLSTTASSSAAIGTYDITGTALNPNYDITFTGGKDAYTITQREVTVDVDVADKQYDGLVKADIVKADLQNVAAADAEQVALRIEAKFASCEEGEDVEIVFPVCELTSDGGDAVLKNYKLIPPSGIKANITNTWNPEKDTEYTTSSVNEKGWRNQDLVITAKEGYELSDTNTADGTWTSELTASEEGAESKAEFYVRNKATGAISRKVTEHYKLDKNTDTTGTTGWVAFQEVHRYESLQDMTFVSLYFSEPVVVTAGAADALSGVERIEFYETKQALSLEELQTVTDWTRMPADGVTVSVEDGKQFGYYIRITDQAGNVTYLSTDGAEYDFTVPVLTGLEDGKVYYTTQAVHAADKNLESVFLSKEGGKARAAASEDVTEENEKGAVTLKGNTNTTYRVEAVDKAGNRTVLTVEMKSLASLKDPIKDVKETNATDADKEKIKDVISKAEELLKEEQLTEEEKQELNDIRNDAEDLLERIAEAEKKAEEDAKKEKENAKKETESAKNAKKIPSTGDDTNFWMWMVLLAVGAVSICITAVFRKKHKTNR